MLKRDCDAGRSQRASGRLIKLNLVPPWGTCVTPLHHLSLFRHLLVSDTFWRSLTGPDTPRRRPACDWWPVRDGSFRLAGANYPAWQAVLGHDRENSTAEQCPVSVIWTPISHCNKSTCLELRRMPSCHYSSSHHADVDIWEGTFGGSSNKITCMAKIVTIQKGCDYKYIKKRL